MSLPNQQGGSGAGYANFFPANGIKVAKATFDPSAKASHRTVAAHTLDVVLPLGALVIGGCVHNVTTFTSANDSATIALHIKAANDLVTATAISAGGNIWDAGNFDVVPDMTGSTAITLTAASAVTATVGTQALTGGKAEIYLYYIEANA